MIIKENITLYICEFCKKKLFVRHAMERHIKYCTQNPANFKACTNCVNLEERTVEYNSKYEDDDYGTTTRHATGFFCKKLEKMLYPLKVERLRLPEKYPATFEGQEPMPTECEHFKRHHGWDD